MTSLNFAGRATLAQSVLSSVPQYTRQTVSLFASIHADLDRATHRLLWNEQDGRHTVHTVSWERICMPKSLGGLGLHRMDICNKARMKKLT